MPALHGVLSSAEFFAPTGSSRTIRHPYEMKRITATNFKTTVKQRAFHKHD